MFKVEVYIFGRYSFSRRCDTKADAVRYVQTFNDGNTVSKAIHAW